MDKNYWKNYYKSHKIGEKPSLFAEFVLGRLKGEGDFANSSDFMESNAESLESSLRDSANAESWQSIKKINSHEAQPNLAPFRCAKKSDYINETNLAESRRIEKVENTESLKDSNIMDCHANPYGLSRNDASPYRHCERSEAIQKSIESAKDSNVLDCHDSAFAESRNDDSLTVFARKSAGLTKQSIRNYTESSDKMDYHEFNKLNSNNDENDTDSHEAFTSSNDKQRANSHDSHDFYNNDATLHNAKSHKDSDITLLELGCGNGRDAIFFAKNGIKVIAIDQVADEISYLASLYAENPHFVSGDFTDLDTIFKGLDSHSASSLSSLRKQLTHTCKSIKSCEAQPNLAPLRGAEKEEKGGSSASALLELEAEISEALPLKAKKRSFLARRGSGEEGAALFAKKSDYINENNLAESRRSERVESAETHTESNAELHKDSSDSAESSDFNLVDCHEFNKLNSRNDGEGVDCQIDAVAESRNDDSMAVPSNTNSCNDEWRADYNKSQGKSFNDGIRGDFTHSARFHCIYSRFTLHSITHSQQETLLSQIPRYLAKDGILAIEARGLKNSLYQKGEAVLDEADAFIYDSHYRRFVDLQRLCEVLRSLDFHIEFAKEERGFAPFNGEDDYFFRIIATRGGAELVFFVCFQPRISTLYASTKWHKPLENVA